MTVVLENPKCPVCSDTGWTGWHKPMSDAGGRMQLIFVPQRCLCKSPDQTDQKIEISDTTEKH